MLPKPLSGMYCIIQSDYYYQRLFIAHLVLRRVKVTCFSPSPVTRHQNQMLRTFFLSSYVKAPLNRWEPRTSSDEITTLEKPCSQVIGQRRRYATVRCLDRHEIEKQLNRFFCTADKYSGLWSRHRWSREHPVPWSRCDELSEPLKPPGMASPSGARKPRVTVRMSKCSCCLYSSRHKDRFQTLHLRSGRQSIPVPPGAGRSGDGTTHPVRTVGELRGGSGAAAVSRR